MLKLIPGVAGREVGMGNGKESKEDSLYRCGSRFPLRALGPMPQGTSQRLQWCRRAVPSRGSEAGIRSPILACHWLRAASTVSKLLWLQCPQAGVTRVRGTISSTSFSTESPASQENLGSLANQDNWSPNLMLKSEERGQDTASICCAIQQCRDDQMCSSMHST